MTGFQILYRAVERCNELAQDANLSCCQSQRLVDIIVSTEAEVDRAVQRRDREMVECLLGELDAAFMILVDMGYAPETTQRERNLGIC